MMTLAQRVRDFRYAKGWGPDELANRAEISRTALYQIESGKTELPRAGTLRRIAVALDVSMDALLGEEPQPASYPSGSVSGTKNRDFFRPRAIGRWFPSEGAPLAMPAGGAAAPDEFREPMRSVSEGAPRPAVAPQENVLTREGELMSKLHDLLHSPVGSAVARVLDELHGLLPGPRNSI